MLMLLIILRPAAQLVQALLEPLRCRRGSKQPACLPALPSSHRLFGEDETIVGYDGLSIDIWLTPQFQVCWAGPQHTQQVGKRAAAHPTHVLGLQL